MDLSGMEVNIRVETQPPKHSKWAIVAPPSPPRRVKAHTKQRPNKKALRRAAQAAAALDPAAPLRCRRDRDPSVQWLEPENEEGNVEYKLLLSGSNPIRYEQLVTQMKYRLEEGHGEAFYYLGVEDDGYPRGLEPHQMDATLATLRRMAAALGARATLVEHLPGSQGRTAALVHVVRNTEEEVACTDLRVAVAGSTDSGKSTLTAVLTHGSDGRPMLDNGRGRARMAVLRHKHEIQTGRTSSISQSLLGYDEDGRVINYEGVAPPTLAEVCSAASKAVTFIDLGGHHAFLKTTLFGLTSMLPDYALLCVCASTGVTDATREHLAVAMALEVPAAFVMTKCDAAEPSRLEAVLGEVRALAATAAAAGGERGGIGGGGTAAPASAGEEALRVVNGDEEAAAAAAQLSKLRGGGCGANGNAPSGGRDSTQCAGGALSEDWPSFLQLQFPVFFASSVTGAGLSCLHAFLSRLQPAATAAESGGGARCSVGKALSEGGLLFLGASHRSESNGGSTSSSSDSSAARAASTSGSSSSSSSGVSDDGEPEDGDGDDEDEAPGSRRAAAKQLLPQQPPSRAAPAALPGHFQVFHTFDVDGMAVACGICVQGTISLGQRWLWGPGADGSFTPAVVTGIHRGQVPVKVVRPGQTATLALEAPSAANATGGAGRQAREAAAAVAVAQRCRERMQEQGRQRRAALMAEAAIAGAGDGSSGAGGSRGASGGSASYDALDVAAEVLADCMDGGSGGSDAMGGADVDLDDDFGVIGGFDDADLGGFEGGTLAALESSRGNSESSCGSSDGDKRCADVRSASASVCVPDTAQNKLELAGASSVGSLLGSSPSNSRKGGVLLGGMMSPRTYWGFEAAVMLLGGHWPARGLVSGRWPPERNEGASGRRQHQHNQPQKKQAVQQTAQQQQQQQQRGQEQREGHEWQGVPHAALRLLRSSSSGKQHSRDRQPAEHCFVVHCNSVRQVARVVQMQELEGGGSGRSRSSSRAAIAPPLPSSLAAAAALLRGARGAGRRRGGEGEGEGRSQDEEAWAPSVARVRFQFVHRPEWLQVGARIILRDRSDGHVAAAGCIAALLPEPCR